MLTHLDPHRLAATATVLAVATALAVWVAQPDHPPATSATSDHAAAGLASRTAPDRPTPPQDALTAAPTGTPPVRPEASDPTPSPDVPAPASESQPTLSPTGRTRATTDVERLAVQRLHADATGRDRDRWPDLTGTPCCQDLTITGIATTSPGDAPAPQTVIITWTATDRYDGRTTHGATTTTWDRDDGWWAAVMPMATSVHPRVRPRVRPHVRPGVLSGGRPVTPPASSPSAKFLLSGGLVAARAADIRHTPLMQPSECRAPRSGRGV